MRSPPPRWMCRIKPIPVNSQHLPAVVSVWLVYNSTAADVWSSDSASGFVSVHQCFFRRGWLITFFLFLHPRVSCLSPPFFFSPTTLRSSRTSHTPDVSALVSLSPALLFLTATSTFPRIETEFFWSVILIPPLPSTPSLYQPRCRRTPCSPSTTPGCRWWTISTSKPLSTWRWPTPSATGCSISSSSPDLVSGACRRRYN